MLLNTKPIISITEAKQNFSKATKLVDRYGQVIITKNKKAKYLITNLTHKNM